MLLVPKVKEYFNRKPECFFKQSYKKTKVLFLCVTSFIFDSEHFLLLDSKIKVYEGALSNLPDEDSHKAALSIYNEAKQLKDNDIALVLISGKNTNFLKLYLAMAPVFSRLTGLLLDEADVEEYPRHYLLDVHFFTKPPKSFYFQRFLYGESSILVMNGIEAEKMMSLALLD